VEWRGYSLHIHQGICRGIYSYHLRDMHVYIYTTPPPTHTHTYIPSEVCSAVWILWRGKDLDPRTYSWPDGLRPFGIYACMHIRICLYMYVCLYESMCSCITNLQVVYGLCSFGVGVCQPIQKLFELLYSVVCDRKRERHCLIQSVTSERERGGGVGRERERERETSLQDRERSGVPSHVPHSLHQALFEPVYKGIHIVLLCVCVCVCMSACV